MSVSAPSFEVPADAIVAAAPPPRCVASVVRVGLVGCGRVGSALCDLVAENADDLARRHGVSFRIETALVRDASRERRSLPGGARLVTRADEFLAREHDVVVEASGGVEPAASVVATLLARGTNVVSANKALLAERLPELRSLAAASGASLRIEASVAAGIPLFSLLERSLATTRVAAVTAILNGTSNFVLSRVARGGTFDAALDEARRLGYAERDATLDVDGIDASQKLRVLVAERTGAALPASRVAVEGIAGVTATDCARAAALGHRLRPVARVRLDGGAPSGWVAPAAVPDAHPLAAVDGADSGVVIEGEPVGTLFLAGPGAGPRPTAASILDDLLAIVRGDAARSPPAAADFVTVAAPPEPTHRGPLARNRADLRAARRSHGETSQWLVTLIPSEGGLREDEVVAFLRAEGLVLRRIVERDEAGGPVLVALTTPAAPDVVARAAATLRAVGAVHDLRAFRAVPSLR